MNFNLTEIQKICKSEAVISLKNLCVIEIFYINSDEELPKIYTFFKFKLKFDEFVQFWHYNIMHGRFLAPLEWNYNNNICESISNIMMKTDNMQLNSKFAKPIGCRFIYERSKINNAITTFTRYIVVLSYPSGVWILFL